MNKARAALLCFTLLTAIVLVAGAERANAVVKASDAIYSGNSQSKEVTSGTKISVFNQMLELSYPRNSVLIDVYDAGKLAGDQTVTITVYLPQGGSPNTKFYTLVSNIYKISVVDSAYRLVEPGQITISYNPGVSSTVADQLSIWYNPGLEQDGRWKEEGSINLGGITNASRKTVTAPFQFNGKEGYYAVFLGQRMFSEFSGGENLGVAWSHPHVLPLWAKGIVEPLPFTSPDQTVFGLVYDVNRLELTAMLVKGMGIQLPTKVEGVFGDVYEGDTPGAIDPSYFGGSYNWEAPGYHVFDQDRTPAHYVEAAARHGLVYGDPDGNFRPGDKLTRQEAAVIMARVANLKLSDDVNKVKLELEKMFSDGSDCSPWAAPAILAVVKAKIMEGEPVEGDSKLRRFDPEGYLTRAEAITLTYRLMKKLKKI